MLGERQFQEDTMATIAIGGKSVEQILKELSEQQFDTEAQAAMLLELKERVTHYEQRYGMPSDRIHEAIDAGELIEDLDVCHWIMDYELLQSAEED
jgi:hypothetical protein